MYLDKDGKQYSDIFYCCYAEAKDLAGRVVWSVVQTDNEIFMHFEDGYTAKFYHEQDCCESVWVEDVNGDWDDLYKFPLIVAEERRESGPDSEWGDSSTYTFYTFRTVKSSVDVRWCGQSNGYYSESVDLKLWKEV